MVYIYPPLNSPHYNNEYGHLESEINLLTDKGKILIMGDYNSRTSTGVDFISDDEVSQHMSDILPENYKSDIYLSRKSQD